MPSHAPRTRHRFDRLFAVRHGESLANARFRAAAERGHEEVVLAGTDAAVPLTDCGVAQAGRLGCWLASLAPSEAPTLVVTSTYLRARETWRIMAAEATERGRPQPEALPEDRLRDREMGVFALHTRSALRARAPEEADRLDQLGPWAYRPPGGESLADVAERVRGFLAELDVAAPGHRVLVVAHDATVVALRHVLTGIGAGVPELTAGIPNASVSQWDGGRLVRFCDTAHLTAEETAAEPAPSPAATDDRTGRTGS